MRIFSDIKSTIGLTPIVKLNRIAEGLKAEILAKLEFFNPLGSVKDRIAASMIEAAEAEGIIGENTTIVEPTSGNTGIALAFICAAKKYRLVLTMPETMSIERQKLLRHLGAQLVLTPGQRGMKGAVAKATEMVADHDNAFMPDQFSNPANPAAHKATTGPEIWEATQGKIDIFVAGVGTGGTLSGVSGYIKGKKSELISVAVEPEDSPVLSGGQPGPHPIQGIGAGFVPANLNRDLVDQIFTVKGEDAMSGAKTLANSCAILCGISSGANFHAAFQTGLNHPGKHIVFVACDTGERYISTHLFDQ